MSIAQYHAGKPGRRPWHKRINWTWNRVKEAPPVPPGVEYDWIRKPLFGHYDNRYNVFGPYRRPILDATGGGQLYARQLGPLAPNVVYNQTTRQVSITGDGSELQGQFTVLPLVNAQNSTPGSEVVSVTTTNGVTNIQLGNTTQGQQQ